MARIARCEVSRRACPLSRPYSLSFATLTVLDVLLVRAILDDGRSGIGEAVALPGYSSETADGLLDELRAWLPTLSGRDSSLFLNAPPEGGTHSVSTRSVVMAALEAAEGIQQGVPELRVPLVHPISAQDDTEMVLDDARAAWGQGFRTFKLKIGRDIARDLAAIEALLGALPEDARLRIDANQGYDDGAARRLAGVFDHPRASMIECLEQPFGAGDWVRHAAWAREYPDIPLMLDESIYTLEDIRRARAIGASWVKLKLCKHRGIHDTATLGRAAKALGLRTVLGNGVATDVGNLGEAIAYHLAQGAFEETAEFNGFIKLDTMLLTSPPREEGGAFYWGPAESPWVLAEDKEGSWE